MGEVNSTESDTNSPTNSSSTREIGVNRKRLEQYYTVGKKIGHGAFAKVYRCYRRSDSCEFAVKKIDKRYLSRTELIGLRNEIQILKHMAHENVIRLVDVFDDGHIVSMVLELCAAKDLFEALVGSERKRFSEQKAAKIVHSIAKALDHLHHKGVVHRDLKPENILFGIDGKVKITDFGLSHFAKASKDEASDEFDFAGVRMKTACGTPHYVAPEIVTGNQYNYKVDTWSLGVLMYVLLVGYQPFHGDTCKAIYKLIASGKYEVSSKRWKCVSKEAKHLVRKLLETNPNKRYSARDVLCHPWIAKHMEHSYDSV